jgi:hypothetical protein
MIANRRAPRRAALGSRTAPEPSREARKPWLKLEMSRQIWCRRQAKQRKGRSNPGASFFLPLLKTGRALTGARRTAAPRRRRAIIHRL